MKQIIQKFWILVTMLCVTNSVSAYDFEVDGLYYDILDLSSLTVKVVGCNDKINGELIIPSTVKYSNRELNVVEIADGSFARNARITSLQIGDNVESIGSDSFRGCSSLISIDIPNSIKKIGAYSFLGCYALNKINIKDLESWCMVDRGSDTFESHSNLYLNDALLTMLNIPNNIIEIKPYTFDGFSNIIGVNFPRTIKKIGAYAFNGCSINSLSLPESLDSIMTGAFGGISIEELTIPKNVIYLGELHGMPKLKKIEFEDSEIPIKLKFAVSGKNIDTASEWIFSEFTYNTDIEELYIGRPIDMDCTNGYWINGNLIMTSYKECLIRSAFCGLKTLKKVVIGENCNQITPQWFYGCTNLENLIILDSATPIEFFQNIYYDKERPNTIPRYSTQYAYVRTFADCPLSSIYIGRDITYTQKDNDASYQNKRLSPFQNKETIEDVVIGDFVTNLPATNFFENDNIKHLEIGQSLINIPDRCLAGNDAIVSIVLKSENPPAYSANFSNSTYINTSLYVPKKSIGMYQTTEPWRNFWNISDIENMDTAINPVKYSSSNEINIISDGIVYVSNMDTQLCIYGIDGKIYYSAIVNPLQSIRLSKGIYIIKLKNETLKIEI